MIRCLFALRLRLALMPCIALSLYGLCADCRGDPVGFRQLLTLADIDFDNQGDTEIVSGQIIGADAYFLLNGGAASQRFVRLSDVLGNPQGSAFATDFVSDPDVQNPTVGQLRVLGGQLYLNDSLNDAIFQLSTAGAGTTTKLLSRQDGIDFFDPIDLQQWNPGFGAPDPSTGEYVVYETTTDQLARVSGGGAATWLDSTDLTALISDDVPNGIQFIDANRIILGDADGAAPGEAYYLINTTSMTSETLVGEADLLGVLNPAIVNAGGNTLFDISLDDHAILFAPDGRFYFEESNSNSLLSLDPLAADPAGTLQIELLGTGYDPEDVRFTDLVWIGGRIGWVNGLDNGPANQGLFVTVPEPATLAALALALSMILVTLRRRSA